jgi:peptidoglycan/xylan/chitin deacetylase (PgdA/CDA1 family)
MNARYVVRFDDICPTMNWDIWSRVEEILMRHDVRPILAVVPDNQDPSLVVGPARADFWNFVRDRQRLGWAIAMHGCHHLYESSNAGLLKINRYSEFSGLSYEAQRRKIAAAAAVFASENVRVDAWIAPGHNFDAVTLKVVREHGIHALSDGFFPKPVEWMGLTWVPQQLWRFRAMPFGLWTVCYHSNGFSEECIRRLDSDLQKFRPRLIDFGQARSHQPLRSPNTLDRVFSALWHAALVGKVRWTARRRDAQLVRGTGDTQKQLR